MAGLPQQFLRADAEHERPQHPRESAWYAEQRSAKAAARWCRARTGKVAPGGHVRDGCGTRRRHWRVHHRRRRNRFDRRRQWAARLLLRRTIARRVARGGRCGAGENRPQRGRWGRLVGHAAFAGSPAMRAGRAPQLVRDRRRVARCRDRQKPRQPRNEVRDACHGRRPRTDSWATVCRIRANRTCGTSALAHAPELRHVALRGRAPLHHPRRLVLGAVADRPDAGRSTGACTAAPRARRSAAPGPTPNRASQSARPATHRLPKHHLRRDRHLRDGRGCEAFSLSHHDRTSTIVGAGTTPTAPAADHVTLNPRARAISFNC